MIQKISNIINGYDFFISYTWRDGRIYAQELYNQLTALDFVCFLDDVNYKKGDDWSLVGAIALRHTGKLLLVVTPEIENSDPVLRELRVFKKTNREIIPIDIGFTFEKFPIDSTIMEIIDPKILRINEDKNRQQKGPSDTTIQEIQQNFDLTKQNTKRIHNLTITIIVLLVFLVSAIFLYFQSEKHRTEAVRETARVLETQGQSAQENGLQMSSMSYYASAIAKRAEIKEESSIGRLRLGALADRTPILRSIFQAGEPIVKIELGPQGRYAVVYSRFSPKSGYAKSGYTNATLWDVTTGELIARFDEDERNFQFSPDGHFMVSYDGNRAALWSASSGKHLRYFDGHTSFVTKAVFSPDADGKEIITSSRDGTVRLWSADTGAELACFNSELGGIYELQFSPSGQFIATAALGGVALWDYKSRSMKRAWPLERGAADVHFSKDGIHLAAIPSDYYVNRVPDANDYNGYLWNIQTSEMISVLESVTSVRLLGDNRIFLQLHNDGGIIGRGKPPREGQIAELRVSTSNSAAASVQSNLLSVPDNSDNRGDLPSTLNNDTRVEILRNVDGLLIAVSPSEDSFIAIHAGVASLINSKTGRISCVLGDGISVAKYAPNGGAILTNAPDNTARLWNTASCQPDIAFEGHTAPVADVAFGSDGMVMTASKDGTVRIWDLNGDSVLSLNQHYGDVTVSEISTDGNKIVTASPGYGRSIHDYWADGKMIIWDTRTGRTLAEIDDIGKSYEGNTSLQHIIADFHNERIFSSYRHIVSGLVLHLVKIVNTSDGSLVATINQGTLRGFSPSTSSLVTADYNQVHVWDSQTGELRFSIEGRLPVDDPQIFPDVIAVLVNENDKLDYALQPWSLINGKPGARIEPIQEGLFDNNAGIDYQNSWSIDLVFSENQRQVALLSDFGNSLLGNLTTGKITGQFKVPPYVTEDGKGVNGSSTDLSLFSPDSRYLVTVGNATYLWDAVTGEHYSTFRGRFLAFHPKSTQAATLIDGQVITWDLAKREHKHILRWGEEQATTANYSHDGKWLIVGTKSGRIDVWDVNSGAMLVQLGRLNNAVASIAVSRTNQQILASSVTGQVSVWSANGVELADDRIVEWVSVRTGLKERSGRILSSSKNKWHTDQNAFVDKLERAMEENKDMSHRLSVADALIDVSPANPSAIRTLIDALKIGNRNDVNVPWNILRKTDHDSPEFIQQVLNGIRSRHLVNDQQALLVTLLGRETIPEIGRLIKDNDELDVETRAQLVFSLRRFGSDAIDILGEAVTSKEWQIRLTAAKVLEDLGFDAQKASTQLVQAIGMDNPEARIAAGRALIRIGAAAIPELIEGLESSKYYTRFSVIGVLADIGHKARKAIVPLVGVALHDTDKKTRFKAAHAVATIDSVEDGSYFTFLTTGGGRSLYTGELSIELLAGAIQDDNQEIKRRCLETLAILRNAQGYGEGPTDGLFVIALKDQSYEIRDLATRILIMDGAVGVLAKAGKIVIPHIVKLLNHGDRKTRAQAMMGLWAVAKEGKDVALWTRAILAARGDDATSIYAKHTLRRLGKLSLPFLIESLNDDSATIRAEAAMWIGNLKKDGKEAYSALEIMLDEPEPLVRLAVANAILDIGETSERLELKLITLLQQSKDSELRSRIAATMRKVKVAGQQLINTLESAMKDDSPRVRYEAASSLIVLETKIEQAIDTLQALLLPQTGDAEVSVNAVSRLAKLGDAAQRSIPTIRQAASAFPVEFDVNKRMKFVWALVELKALDELIDVVANETYISFWYSQIAKDINNMLLERLDSLPRVIKLLNNDNYAIREYGCKILGALGTKAKSAVPALTKTMSDDNDRVRNAARLAIEAINKQ